MVVGPVLNDPELVSVCRVSSTTTEEYQPEPLAVVEPAPEEVFNPYLEMENLDFLENEDTQIVSRKQSILTQVYCMCFYI